MGSALWDVDFGVWILVSGFWAALQAPLAAELQVVCDSEGHLSDSGL